MTIEAQFQIWNVTAAEDLTGDVIGKAISIAGTVAAGMSLAIGVARSKAPLGGQISVVYKGITKVKVGAAVTTPGWPIAVAATSGWFTPATAAASGGTLGTGHVGRLLNTAAVASGDLVPAMLDFTFKPPYAGV